MHIMFEKATSYRPARCALTKHVHVSTNNNIITGCHHVFSVAQCREEALTKEDQPTEEREATAIQTGGEPATDWWTALQ